MKKIQSLLAALYRLSGRFSACRMATSGLEFALILPVLVTLIMGTAEWSRYTRYERHLTRTVKFIAQNLAANVNSDGTLLEDRFHSAGSGAVANFPEIATGEGCGGWWCDSYITYEFIKFKPTNPACTIGCTYTGSIAFDWWQAACGTVNPVATGADTGLYDVDSAVFGPGYLIKVIGAYTYKPYMFSAIFPARTFIKVAYATPIASSTITLAQSTPSQATVCP